MPTAKPIAEQRTQLSATIPLFRLASHQEAGVHQRPTAQKHSTRNLGTEAPEARLLPLDRSEEVHVSHQSCRLIRENHMPPPPAPPEKQGKSLAADLWDLKQRGRRTRNPETAPEKARCSCQPRRPSGRSCWRIRSSSVEGGSRENLR